MTDRRTPDSMVDTGLAVWSRRRLEAVAVFLAVLVSAVTVAASLPSIYRSTATVLVERQDARDALVRPGLPSELETRLHTIGQEALSRGRLESLMARFDLYPALRARGTADAAVEQFRRDIAVAVTTSDAPGRGTIAFRLSFRGRDPEVVAQVANTLASFYVEEDLRIRARQAQGAARLLAGHLAEVKGRLDDQERRIEEFKRRHMGELPEQVTANLATLERLNAQLALNGSNQSRVLEQRATLARQFAEPGPPLDAQGREGPRARLTRLKQELVRLRLRYKDTYPDVAQLKAEIAALEAENLPASAVGAGDAPGTGADRGLAGTDAELARLRAEEQGLRRDIEKYQRRVEAAPEREQEIQSMSSDYRATKEQYDATLKRYQDALIAEDVAQGRAGDEFRILDPAMPERAAVAPNRARLGLVGAFLALAAAAGAVVLAESLDTSFHGLADLRAFTNVPVLARIPRMAVAGDGASARARRWLAVASIAAGLVMVALACHHLARGNERLVWMLSRAS